MPLHLRYAFTPTPNPIRASVGGANPNLVTLQVMVSNPSLDPLSVTIISITIPVGSDASGTLSASESLPPPQYDADTGWTVGVDGGTLTLTPPAGGVTNAFILTLPGIQINDKFGVVPLTIVELAPPAPKVIDSTTYSLVKLEADFPVTNFYASPATLDDLDQTATLKWECSDQGEHFVYSVHSDSWQPGDCLDGGQCLSCADGGKGIQTPQLQQTTTFALDVIRKNPDGSRSIYQTLSATVRVLMPSIKGNSYQETFFSNHLVRLHWIATDAAYCTVSLDGNVIDERAPTDTYEEGYWVTALLDKAGAYQLSVTAHARFGHARAQYPFELLELNPPANVNIGGSSTEIAVTHDGKLALVTPQPYQLTLINLSTLQPEADGIALNNNPWKIRATPDSKLALVTTYSDGFGPVTLWIVDIARRQALAPIPSLTNILNFRDHAITPDGKFVLALKSKDVGEGSEVLIVDIASREVAGTVNISYDSVQITITSDGKLAFVANYWDRRVSVIDVEKRQVVDTVTVGGSPMIIAVTPDGQLALVANQDDATVTVINVATLKAEPHVIENVPNANGSDTLAITPDGSLAFLASESLTMIDIPNRKALNLGPADQDVVAVTPDGQHLLLSTYVDITVI